MKLNKRGFLKKLCVSFLATAMILGASNGSLLASENYRNLEVTSYNSLELGDFGFDIESYLERDQRIIGYEVVYYVAPTNLPEGVSALIPVKSITFEVIDSNGVISYLNVRQYRVIGNMVALRSAASLNSTILGRLAHNDNVWTVPFTPDSGGFRNVRTGWEGNIGSQLGDISGWVATQYLQYGGFNLR